MQQDTFPVLNFQDFISADGDRLTTDSLKVSAVFGKKHFNVLRDIERLLAEVDPDFAKLNFEVCREINELQNGKPQPFYRMTRDGFSLLAMGFTGKRAIAFKVAYIGAFNAMYQYIRVQHTGLTARYFEQLSEFKGKKEVATIHGRGLRKWRFEKPPLLASLASIEEKMNPQLELVQKAG
jgi:Rha family phage regulatory protein